MFILNWPVISIGLCKFYVRKVSAVLVKVWATNGLSGSLIHFYSINLKTLLRKSYESKQHNKTSSGCVITGCNATGPAGPAGATRLQGLSGATGAQGPAGANGLQGLAGATTQILLAQQIVVPTTHYGGWFYAYQYLLEFYGDQ